MPTSTERQPALVNRVGPVVRTEIVVTPPAPSGRRRRGVAAVGALVLLACGLRAVAFFSDRPLWIDEAMLALNLIDRPAARLLDPLDWNQAAPPGFLLLSKLAVDTLGMSEFALRLVPFVGSLLGVAAFAWLARRLLPPAAGLLALGLFAVSPHLVGYSGECKQYATDAAIAVGLFALALPLLDTRNGSESRGTGQRPVHDSHRPEACATSWESAPQAGAGRWAAVAAGGAAAVWFSHPAAFVLGGIGVPLLAAAALRRDRPRFLAACGAAGCWAASFAALYWICLRPMGANNYLQDYWAGHFLPLPPTSPGDLTWLADHYFRFFDSPGGLGGTEIRAGGLAAVLALGGAWAFARERWRVAAALALPAAFALLASGVHKYPFNGRLLLFLVPGAVLLVARGAGAVGSALWARQPVVTAVLFAVLAAAPALEAFQDFERPDRNERLPEVLAAVRADWQPGDAMYVYYGAEPAFRFYTREAPFPAGAVVFGREARRESGSYRDDLTGLVGRPRVWMVFSHRHGDEETQIRTWAEGLGRIDRTVRATGAVAYRFDFTRGW